MVEHWPVVGKLTGRAARRRGARPPGASIRRLAGMPSSVRMLPTSRPGCVVKVRRKKSARRVSVRASGILC
ncbi:hypothetical protein WS62_26780 [Burkholderia sp. ABCPW 14]|nr:hypothetical protein WS62_26780 [Burkholderia sp. ABCPW 14]